MRRSLTVLFTLAIAASLVGCGSNNAGESAAAAAASPHGGVMVPLPGSDAVVEVLNGDGVRMPGGIQMPIVVYVLNADQATPVADPPGGIAINLETSKGRQNLTLKRDLVPGDPAASARYISEVGPYDLTGSGGELSVQVNGKMFTEKFRGPR